MADFPIPSNIQRRQSLPLYQPVEPYGIQAGKEIRTFGRLSYALEGGGVLRDSGFKIHLPPRQIPFQFLEQLLSFFGIGQYQRGALVVEQLWADAFHSPEIRQSDVAATELGLRMAGIAGRPQGQIIQERLHIEVLPVESEVLAVFAKV